VATLGFKKGQQLDLPALKKAATDSGFELMWIELVLRGSLISVKGPDHGESLAIHLARTGQTVFLGPGDSEKTRSNFRKAAGWAAQGLTYLEIRGRAHAHPGAAPGMTISMVKKLANPTGK